jgi:hypothetical protein
MTATKRLLAGSVLIIGLLVVAACGGGAANPGVAALGNKSARTTTAAPAVSPAPGPSRAEVQAGLLVFVACMRKNGVPNLPDPVNGSLLIKASSGIDPNTPQFQAAQKTCQHLMPQLSAAQQHSEEARLLEGAQCMRSHGVPNFPDPQFDAEGHFKMVLPPGLNPSMPQVQRAQRACRSLMPFGGP